MSTRVGIQYAHPPYLPIKLVFARAHNPFHSFRNFLQNLEREEPVVHHQGPLASSTPSSRLEETNTKTRIAFEDSI